MTHPAPAHRLVIHNRFSEIRNVISWLEQTIHQLGLQKNQQFNFELCADEAITNIIHYAYQDESEHEIILSLFVRGEAVSLEIGDDGIPFNPLLSPGYTCPTSLQDASVGGLGIHLMQTHMDECRYDLRHGKNVLTLTARIKS